MGVGDAIVFGHYMTASGSDTAMRVDASFPEVHAAVHARLWDRLSLGARGTYYWLGSGYDPSNSNDVRVDFHFWRVAMAARWHLLGDRPVAPFLEVEAGVAHASESGAGSGNTSGLTTATIGGAVGVNFALGRYLALGPELRAVVLPFRDAGQNKQELIGSPLYGTVVAVSLGLSISGRIPLR